MNDPAQASRPKLRVLSGGRGLPEAQPDPEPQGSWLEPTERWRWPLLLLVGLALLRLGVAAVPGLAADEAYYWVWGQHLDLGYYDHPPLIAWLVRGSGALLGHSELGVRALSVLLGVAAVALLAISSRRPWIAAMSCASLPLFALGGLLATPDIPLVFGWALCLAGLVRGGRWWLVAGLGAAVAILGKHTGLMLIPLMLLARPRDLRSRWPWLGLGLCGLLLLPHLAWLASNDWVTLRFQADHGLGLDGSATLPGLGGLLSFLGGQIGLVSPLLFLCFVAYWAVGWMDRGVVRMWWLLSFPVFAFFALASMLARSEANWPAPAYLAACVGLAHMSSRWRRIAWVGIGFAAVSSALLTVHALRPLWPLPRDPTLSLVGGEILGEAVQAWGIEPVYTSRYQEAAWIRFYGGIHAEVLPGAGRISQFDLWPGHPDPSRALFVRPWRTSPPRKLDPFWAERDGPNTVVAPDSLLRRAGRWQVYELWEYQGGLGDGVPGAAQ
jgi:4-amino-4-deoxy-L-arabinose transferase-like glycosyltransferase